MPQEFENGSRSYLVRLGVALLLFVAALACEREISIPDAPSGPDGITIDGHRFDELKKYLPAHGVVGYVSDSDPATDGSAQWYLTEYALAPIQVTLGSDPDVIIGRFSDISGAVRITQQNDLRVVRDFGGGVMLLTRDHR